MEKFHNKAWWRNTNERNLNLKDRKISWLELFYDLVYVIAISKVTNHLYLHLDVSGFLDFVYLVSLIYWGWLNGSWHHDILGANDVRTIFLTLWQMVILSALIVTLTLTTDGNYFNATIVILIMQIYITYLWWSEGIYDNSNKNIRNYYVGFYLLAFVLILSTFFITQQPFIRIIFYATLAINYAPAYFVTKVMDNQLRYEHKLSASMTERLGLFIIILFGEVILGVINGFSEIKNLSASNWILFVLCIFIVFTIWFIFFKLIGDKRTKKGYVLTNIYTLMFLPLAMSLGTIGVAFGKIFTMDIQNVLNETINIKLFLGISIAFFLSITLCIYLLVEMPSKYLDIQPKIKNILLGVISSIIIISMFSQYISLLWFLIFLLLILSILPIIILKLWNNLELKAIEQ